MVGARHRAPGDGRRESCSVGTVSEDEKVLEVDSGDGCMALSMDLMPLSRTFKKSVLWIGDR